MTKGRGQMNKGLQSPDSYTILLKTLDLEMSFNLSHRTQKKNTERVA